MESIHICMLGQFSLAAGESVIRDAGTRSKKVWSLLAYLIRHRGRSIPQQKLIDLLWGEDSSSSPENALRITLHRLRALLDQLWSGAGHDLILSRDGGYCWNTEAPVSLDCDDFESLCLSDSSDPDARLEALQKALCLYQGSFLPRQSGELWVVPAATHFSNLYLLASMEAARLLSARSDHRQAAELCRSAAATEVYHEPLHQLLMQELAAAGDVKAAAAVFESLSRRLFDDFGILPSEETRSVYRTVACSPEDRTLPMEEILEHLQEPDTGEGAMQCDYDYFKVLCYAESRSMERSGAAAHVALLRISSGEKSLSGRSLSRIMEQFGAVLRQNLRRGDVISRCSKSQYIVLLPGANYENSCMVCRRVIAAFRHLHPHVSAQIHFMVQPLTPGVRVP